MRRNAVAVGILGVIAMASAAQATPVIVAADGSGDYTSIQAALDAWGANAEIEVRPGWYYEQFDSHNALQIRHDGLRLTSTGGPDVTFISAISGKRAIQFYRWDSLQDVQITGFTICNGDTDNGAGVYMFDDAPVFTNCVFQNNRAIWSGGAIWGYTSTPTFIDCTFTDNATDWSGGGGAISIGDGSITLENCRVCDNGANPILGNTNADSFTLIWDECNDCNANGEPDDEDYENGILTDINEDGVYDLCGPDCDGNGVSDVLEISVGLAPDLNENWIHDQCDSDCDGDGYPDDYELEVGLDQDCNGNGIADACDIADLGEDEDPIDCDGDGVLDACQSDLEDCDGNGIFDICDIADGGDCNENDLLDACEIADGDQDDLDVNGWPDECDCLADMDDSDWVYYDEIVIWLQEYGKTESVADVNQSGLVEVLDLIYVLSHWGACPYDDPDDDDEEP